MRLNGRSLHIILQNTTSFRWSSLTNKKKRDTVANTKFN